MNISIIYPASVQRKVFFILSVLVVVSLPLSVKLNSLAIILLAAHWLLEGDWKAKGRKFSQNPIALLFTAMYMYHVIALLYTTNTHQGSFELEKKISFLIFPLIFGTTAYFDRAVATNLLKWFVGACLAGAIICLAHAFSIYLADGDTSHFFYHELSQDSPIKIHAVYFSVYIAFCIFILIYYLRLEGSALLLSRKRWTLLLIAFLFIFLVLLSSKTVIIAFFALLILIISREMFLKKGFAWSAMCFLLGIGLFILIVVFVPQVRQRFDEVLTDQYEQTSVLELDDYAGYYFTGGNVRLAIWKMLTQEVQKQHAWVFGVSPGDAQDVLTATYREKHVYPGDGVHIDFTSYNAHNQFFQFLISLGLTGVALFVCILGFLIRQSVVRRDGLLFLFVLLFTAFSMTEATFQTQKGIVFFALFAVILFNAKGALTSLSDKSAFAAGHK